MPALALFNAQLSATQCTMHAVDKPLDLFTLYRVPPNTHDLTWFHLPTAQALTALPLSFLLYAALLCYLELRLPCFCFAKVTD